MKNILVISDTHGNTKGIDKLMPKLVECHYIFHLGDINQDANRLKAQFGDKVISVLGNCDGNIAGDEKIVQIEEVKFLLCHGHNYAVKHTLDNLYYRGVEVGVDFCLYGHTHEKRIEKYKNLTLINPGTLSISAYEKSYLYMTVVDKKCFYKIVDIN